MLPVPRFEIGLWNAWILMVLSPLTTMLPNLINREVDRIDECVIMWTEDTSLQ